MLVTWLSCTLIKDCSATGVSGCYTLLWLTLSDRTPSSCVGMLATTLLGGIT
jgi:hypothetical protein